MTADLSRRQELERLEQDEEVQARAVVALPGDEHLWALGFPAWQEVRGRLSVADLHTRRERCGIYVLGFEDGERYVGKAVDVVSRFNQHRKTHTDLSHLTFKQVPRARLDEVEQHYIHHLEAQGLRLRNIAHMSVVTGERDLDLVVSPGEQERWLSRDASDLEDAAVHVQDEGLRRRYRRRFERFLTLPHAQDALLVLGLYLEVMVPFMRRTELSFWAVSCLPDTSAPEGSTLLARVNVNMQEVFSLYATEAGLWGSFHLASSPFQEELGPDWKRQLAETGWEVSEHTWAPGGQDQFEVVVETVDGLLEFLMDWTSLRAMGLFNLRLMRKGATYYGRYHSLDLVDAAQDAVKARESELEHRLAQKEILLMSFDPVSGILSIGNAAVPARFDPSTWLIMASIDPKRDASLTEAAREYPVRFESALANGGTLVGFATYLRDEGEAVYAVRLKSVSDAEGDRAE